MDIFDLPELEICPWALREGVILERLDAITSQRRGRDRSCVTRIGLSTASVYPESTAARVRVRRAAGLRRRRGDGRHRRAQPADLGGHPARRAPRHPGLRRPRAVPAVHPAGLGHRALGQARALRRDGRRGRGRRWSSCTRRSAGRGTTPPGFVDGIAALEERPASRSPSRTCTRGARASRRGDGDLPARAGTPRRSPTPTPRIDLSHAAIAASDPMEMAGRIGSRLRHVHLTDGTGSAKDEHLVPGRGNQTRRRVARARRGRRLRRRRRRRDQHPQGRRPASSARPTCASRSPSRASTSRVPAPPMSACTGASGRRGRRPGRPTPGPRSSPLRAPVRRARVRGHHDPGGRRRRGRRRRRWSTTTSAPRTTSSSPRCSCRSTPARCWLPVSPAGWTVRRSGSSRTFLVGLGRPGRCSRACSRVARGLMDPSASRLLTEGFLPVIVRPVGEALGVDRPEHRMPLVASQVLGLILFRYVLRVEPLASMPASRSWRRTPPRSSAT